MTMVRVQQGGADLPVEVQGDGPPVVFLHGFPFDHTMWDHHVTSLAGYRRIAPDLRVAGASRPGARAYGFERYADDVVAILDALAVPAAVICGLSMGGYIAFDLLRRYGRRVKALVLADTRADADSEDARRARDDMIALVEREGPAALVEQMLPRVLARRTVTGRLEIVEAVRSMMRGWTGEAMIAALRAMRERPDSSALLPAIHVSTLVLVGEDDQITPPATAKQMAGAIPGARLVTIPDAGHLAPFEQPLATVDALTGFLESLP